MEKESDVFKTINRMIIKDKLDNKGRINKLAACMQWTVSYLKQRIFYGSYKPGLEKRMELSKALGLSMIKVNEHFKGADNAKKKNLPTNI